MLSKSFFAWDVFTNFEVHRSFAKDVQSVSFSGTLRPGYGGSLGVGVGYNFENVRLGSSLTWAYEDPVDQSSASGTTPGHLERFATAALTISYLASDEFSGAIGYNDQTWFGNPINTSLGRGIFVQVQRRWSR